MKKTFILCFMFTLLFCSNAKAAALNQTIDHTSTDYYAIRKDGSLWVGESQWKVLWDEEIQGFKDEEYVTEPIKILDNAICVNDGYAITASYELWACNDEVNLLNKNDIEYENGYMKPVKIMDNVIQATELPDNTFILKTDGSLWGKGENTFGQMGIGEKDRNGNYFSETVDELTKIMDNVEKVAIGYDITVVLKTDGSVWTFGSNLYGKLGIGDESVESTSIPVKVMDNISDITVYLDNTVFAITDDDTLVWWGEFGGSGYCHSGENTFATSYSPAVYADDVKAVSALSRSCLILYKDNNLYICGMPVNSETAYSYGDYEFKTGIVSDDINFVKTPSNWEGDISIILNNDGEMFEFGLRKTDDKEVEIKLIKLVDNVMLSEVPTAKSIKEFTDIVRESEESQASIKALSKAGVITGTSDTEFSPNKTLTRAEIGAMLLRMTEHKYETADESVFSDVSKNDWFCGASALCRNYGIVNGYEDNTFRGNDEISKLQLIVLASRTLQNESARYNENVNTAAGIPIPDWAEDDVNTALAYGLIDEADLDNLESPITRSEAAVVLYKLYNLM